MYRTAIAPRPSYAEIALEAPQPEKSIFPETRDVVVLSGKISHATCDIHPDVALKKLEAEIQNSEDLKGGFFSISSRRTLRSEQTAVRLIYSRKGNTPHVQAYMPLRNAMENSWIKPVRMHTSTFIVANKSPKP